jgi:hypothetical protein
LYSPKCSGCPQLQSAETEDKIGKDKRWVLLRRDQGKPVALVSGGKAAYGALRPSPISAAPAPSLSENRLLTCKHPFVARGGIAAIGAEAATATQIGKFRSTPNITLRPTTDDDRFRAAAYQVRTGLAAGGRYFVLRAIGKRFGKDRTAGCEKVVGIRFASDSSLEGGGFEPPVPVSGDTPQRPLITSPAIIFRESSACRLRFARDSPLEGDGFELPVPGRETVKPSWEK